MNARFTIEEAGSHHSLPGSQLRRLAALLLAVSALALAIDSENKGDCAEQRRAPNIVLLLADDMGYGDVRSLNPEHGKIPTPNLDRLVAQGMTFTDAHSGSAVCTPTRYGILTGRYCWRTRLQSSVILKYAPPLIDADRLTVPALLQRHGYRTAAVGKWHLGWNWPQENDKVLFDRPIADGPTARGFQYYFGVDLPNLPPYGFIENDRMTAQPSAWFEAKPKLFPHLFAQPLSAGPIVPGWKFDQILPTLTQKAVEYVTQRSAEQQPFFLYFALTSPHEPIAPSPRFAGKSGISPVADFIMETDWAVGQVVQALEKSGRAQNTLLIFTADNGHCPYTGLQPLLDAGHWPSQRFRGYKADVWEGGHRIPFIARWPGAVKPGAACHQLICLTDLLATCADLLGARLPDNAGEDSVSFLHFLRGAASGPRHEAVVHHSCFGQFAIRQGAWKLELCPGSGGYPNSVFSSPSDAAAAKQGLPAVQLYDMSRDDVEKTNVQDQHPEVVQRLTKLLEKYVADGRSTPGVPQKNDVPVDIWKRDAKAPAKRQ